MQETWKPISWLSGLYEISSLGRVRSLDRAIVCSDGRTIHCKGKVLRQRKDKDGYLSVGLCQHGTPRNARVATLVAQHFLPPSDLPTVNHKDLNKENNSSMNFEWSSQVDNFEHAVRAGVLNAKTNPRRAKKLTLEKVAAIRAARSANRTYASISSEFGIVISTARKIAIGESWTA